MAKLDLTKLQFKDRFVAKTSKIDLRIGGVVRSYKLDVVMQLAQAGKLTTSQLHYLFKQQKATRTTAAKKGKENGED